MIEYKSPEREHLYIPVALYDIFENGWLPASRELGLKLIPLFGTGYPALHLDRETIPIVISELKVLQTYFIDNFDNISEHYINRFTRIISVLEQALSEFDEIEYIRI